MLITFCGVGSDFLYSSPGEAFFETNAIAVPKITTTTTANIATMRTLENKLVPLLKIDFITYFTKYGERRASVLEEALPSSLNSPGIRAVMLTQSSSHSSLVIVPFFFNK